MNIRKEIHAWLRTISEDSISKILLNNSALTTIQLETLLIDTLSEKIIGKKIKNEEKAKLRLSKKEISRGSFERTLKQARTNIVKSIYTILLLGYLGLFESTSLDPFIEIANKLQIYSDAYRNALTRNDSSEQKRVMKLLYNEIGKLLESLSK